MSQSNSKTGQLYFSVDSSLLFQLGEQLVAKPSIALSELVKNAYDADATQVVITMENIETKGGTIVVEDNGHGMTFEEMQKNWMRIATNAKRDKPYSPVYHRPQTGAKGIGRFAARRLGHKLTIQSIAKRSDKTIESVTAEFDWKNSFRPGDDLIEIPITYTRQIVSPDSPTGVSLFIDDARDAWVEEDIVELRRDLLTIQTPFPDLVTRPEIFQDDKKVQPDPGFNIQFEISGERELEQLSGDLGEAFLEAAWARLDGHVDKKGKAHFDIVRLMTDETDSIIDTANNYTGLEGARFRIYFFIYRSEFFSDLEFGVRDAQRKGRSEGGVRIYSDGFRIFPYGDPGDDWLQLDEYNARNIDLATRIDAPKNILDIASSIPGRPFLLIPRNYQLFGAVSISQTKHSDIAINVSRERLIETPTVDKLRRFVQNGIYWMTLKYGAFLAEQRAKQKEEEEDPPQSILAILEETKTTIAQMEIPKETQNFVNWSLNRAIEKAKEEEEERISEISMLRVLASAGTTLVLMNHQLRALISGVLQIREDLQNLRPDIPSDLHNHYDDITDQVVEWHQMVEQQVSQLGFLLSPDSRQRRKRLPLYIVVENVRKPMSFYMKKYNVKFENNVPPNLRTPKIYQAELYSILINILSNALKAVFGQSERRIAVEAEKGDHLMYLRMMDTGEGLHADWKDTPEKAFKAFESKSLFNPVLGQGTGLGLKVVKDILELYSGTAQFIEVEKPWKTCIELTLPE